VKLDRPYRIVWQGRDRVCHESFADEDSMNQRFRTLEQILTREAASTLHREYPKQKQQRTNSTGDMFSMEVPHDEAEE